LHVTDPVFADATLGIASATNAMIGIAARRVLNMKRTPPMTAYAAGARQLTSYRYPN